MNIKTKVLGTWAVKKSDLFDKEWYTSQPGYEKKFLMSPARHYLKYGVKLNLNPSEQFSTADYLGANPDVASIRLNPLVHYELFGKNENRNLKPQSKGVRANTINDCAKQIEEINEKLDFVLKENPEVKFILLFTHLLNLTGAPRALFNYAMGVREAGYYPIVMSLKSGPMEEELDTEQIPHFVLSAIQAKEIIESTKKLMNRCEIVLFNTLATAKYGLLFNEISAYRIAWVHEGEFEYEKVIDDVERFLPTFDMVYSVGEYSKSFTDKYVSAEKSRMFLYGIPDRFTGESVEHDKVTFAMIGSVGKRKAQIEALAAIDMVAPEVRDKARFLFIGDSAEDEATISLLLHEVENENLVYYGSLPNDEVIEIMKGVDCVLVPSLDDPMPIVATEAMMCEKIAIVSDHTGTASLVEEGVNGFVVEAGNVPMLAEKISYVIRNNEKLGSLKKSARIIYTSNFTMDIFKKNIAKMVADAENDNGRKQLQEYYNLGENEAILLDVEILNDCIRVVFDTSVDMDCYLQVGKTVIEKDSKLPENHMECYNEFLAETEHQLVVYSVPKGAVQNSRCKMVLRDTSNREGVSVKFGNFANFCHLSKTAGLYVYVRSQCEIVLCEEKEFYTHSKQLLVASKAMLRVLEELRNGVEKKYHLYIESLDNHNDNAYQLFLEDLKSNQDAYFVTSKAVKKAEKNKKIANHMIVLNSDEFKYMVPRASKTVVSWWMFPVYGYENSAALYPYLNLEFTAVMHGISYDKKSYYLNYLNFGRPNELICCSDKEKEYFEECNGHRNIKVLGYPRMDKWAGNVSKDKTIFLFPTWRKELSDSYLNEICRICIGVVRKLPDYRLVYVAHPSIKEGMYNRICNRIRMISPNIVTYHSSDRDSFNKYFAEAKYLITDYSSVAYDFAYKKGAVVIYDLNPKMIGDHYELRDTFDEGHCGVITYDVEGVLNALSGKYNMEQIESRKQQFFRYLDANNTERVFSEIHK